MMASWRSRNTLMMLVEHLLEGARKRLATLSRGRCLRSRRSPHELRHASRHDVDGEGIALGLISRTDVVRVLVGATADALNASAEAMISSVCSSCHAEQPLEEVWKIMSARSLRCAPDTR